MCDDFFEDHFEDNIFDPSNDFEEDLAGEYAGGEWYEDSENIIAESVTDNSPITPDINSDQFDLSDAILLGMLGGAVYDSTVDENQQLKRVKSKDKHKK